jgi:hypothetical protein
MITPYKATITVEQGKIISAVIDEKWDIISHKIP